MRMQPLPYSDAWTCARALLDAKTVDEGTMCRGSEEADLRWKKWSVWLVSTVTLLAACHGHGSVGL